MEQLYKTKEVCKILDVDEKTLLKMVLAGKIKRLKPSPRIVRYTESAIREFIQQEKKLAEVGGS